MIDYYIRLFSNPKTWLVAIDEMGNVYTFEEQEDDQPNVWFYREDCKPSHITSDDGVPADKELLGPFTYAEFKSFDYASRCDVECTTKNMAIWVSDD